MGCGRTWTTAALLCLAGIAPSGIAGQTPQAPPETPAPAPAPVIVEVPGEAPVAPVAVAATGAPTRERRYRPMSITGGEKGLRSLFEPEQLALLEKLNRRDIPHLARAKTIVVPEEWLPDELLYSPLPLSWEWAVQHPKALIVHQPSQVFGAYENGLLVRWGPVSSGREKNPTPAGLFHLNWRSKGRHSTDNPDWYMPWYFNFHTGRGLAFHQLELPGRPASHACIRLLERDAVWLYGWGQGWTLAENRRHVVAPGTPVLILETYDFAASPPWLSLDWLAAGIELPSEPPKS